MSLTGEQIHAASHEMASGQNAIPDFKARLELENLASPELCTAYVRVKDLSGAANGAEIREAFEALAETLIVGRDLEEPSGQTLRDTIGLGLKTFLTSGDAGMFDQCENGCSFPEGEMDTVLEQLDALVEGLEPIVEAKGLKIHSTYEEPQPAGYDHDAI